MKPIYKFFCTLCVFCSLYACHTDVLDIEQPGVTPSHAYRTATDTEVKQYISAIYAMTLGNSYESVLAGGHASYRSVIYEMSRMSNESAGGYAYNEAADANTYSYIWSYYYKLCYWCTMIIDQLPDNQVASADLKNRVIAEARAVRAISMMQLVQLYGNPPLADHVLTGEEGNTPAATSWAFIESELAAAAEGLPTKNGVNGQAEIGGRLTREAAYAYLGKAMLWQKKYAEAAKTLYDKVIATGKYALVPDFATLNTSAVDFGPENLWEYNFSDEAAVAKAQDGCFDLACFSPDLGVYSTTYGSLWMVFGMGAYPSKEFADFMQTHDTTASGTSARYKGTLGDYSTALTSYEAMFTTYPHSISNCQGYYRVKHMVTTGDLVGEFPYWYSKRNTVYMRYAEVLLNYAEAVAMGGADGALLSGLKALNLVRTRAGLDEAPVLSMDNAIYGVKAERRAELYGEGHLFIDLVRWGDAATELADCGKTAYTCTISQGDIIDLGFGPMQLYNTEVTTSSTGAGGFKSGKNELFPIPATDRQINPNGLKQNPGW